MEILPFKAIRPSLDKAGLVTCRTYDEYTAAELASQLDFNPFSFLHVLHPGYVNIHKTDPTIRYTQVKNVYQDFKNQGILIEDDSEGYYLYELQSSSGNFTGFIAAVAVNDYLNGTLKKHEDTLAYRVDQFETYLNVSGFNTEPVLLAYSKNNQLSDEISNTKNQPVLYDFSTQNRDRHRIWKISNSESLKRIHRLFEQTESLYIADGHHRSASVTQLFQNHNSDQPKSKYFLGFIVEETEVKIHEYNRLIRNLNGLNSEHFLNKVSENFFIHNRGHEWYKPNYKGEFGMYFQGEFFSLKPKIPQTAVDPQVLYDLLLHPILGIEDLRNDSRIDYIPGTESITKMVQLIDEKQFAVGFTLFPVSFAEIRETADNNEILPPKSTYILPKLRSGLITYEL